jgi:hypothetical protein
LLIGKTGFPLLQAMLETQCPTIGRCSCERGAGPMAIASLGPGERRKSLRLRYLHDPQRSKTAEVQSFQEHSQTAHCTKARVLIGRRQRPELEPNLRPVRPKPTFRDSTIAPHIDAVATICRSNLRHRREDQSVLFACHELAALSARDGALATRRRITLASDNNIFAYEYGYVLVPDNSILNVTFG